MKKIILIAFLFLYSASGFCVKWTITNQMDAYTPDSISIHLGDTVRFFIGNMHYSLEVDQSTYNTATDSTAAANGALPGGFVTPYSGGFVYPVQLGVGVHYYFCPPHASHDMKGRIFVINPSGINPLDFSVHLFNVFPNPVSEKLNVSYRIKEKGQVEIKLYDINGKFADGLLSEIKTTGDYFQTFEIDHNLIKKGIYLLELVADKNKSAQKIFIE